jgi:hypothetical protein
MTSFKREESMLSERRVPRASMSVASSVADARDAAGASIPHVMSGDLCQLCAIRYLDKYGRCECTRILHRAPGDRLNCADLTREAAIEVMAINGGILAGIIREKLESLRKPDGPSRETVLAWLCREGFAWRPRNAATEARLTAKGKAKAQSILIHVSAGNY